MDPRAQIGVFGKHPAYGDFLRAGVSDPIVEAMMQWLDPTLAQLRDDLGNDWAAFWDQAQPVRFWIGRGVFGKTLAGIMVASHDRVGRRYPLVLMGEGVAQAAPVVDPDQTVYAALEYHLRQMQPGIGAKALLEGMSVSMPSETPQAAQTGPTVWAHHPHADLAALLGAAVPVEAEHARLTRAMFWAPGGDGRAACWLSHDRMPQSGALGWLLGGVPAQDDIQTGSPVSSDLSPGIKDSQEAKSHAP
ncbi:type VI secretion-associated protein [Thioclava sp. SK-1]|uniref:type VI secretion system-associated protein TagF n=1 Tax=Thioclava sp. SK-1 TaxID=1889770 RepID=UPI0008271C84|nr:type VI secretion system-associated protein TagF [Thioclava sp. SK-1]OCX58184.1 type VI secretion-associated protein [Thioclava sp. SK-1]